MLFLIIKFVASNPVEIADSGVIINPDFAVDGGVLISVPDCFPFCGVEAEVQKFEEIKNFALTFKSEAEKSSWYSSTIFEP